MKPFQIIDLIMSRFLSDSAIKIRRMPQIAEKATSNQSTSMNTSDFQVLIPLVQTSGNKQPQIKINNLDLAERPQRCNFKIKIRVL